MDKPVKDTMVIGFTLILFSTLISFIAYLGIFSKDLLNHTVVMNSFRAELSDARELSVFDNREILGDDVLIAVTQYTKVMPISIEVLRGGTTLTLSLELNSSDSVWSVKYVRDYMGDNVHERYLAKVVRDYHGQPVRLQFTRIQ